MAVRKKVVDRTSIKRVPASKAGLLALHIPEWERVFPMWSDSNFLSHVENGFKHNTLVYACIAVTADTAASVKAIVKDRKTKEPLPDHPLQLLLNHPNPNFSETQFYQTVITYGKISGVSYWEKQRNKMGEVVHLWPIRRPDWMFPIPSIDSPGIAGYQYRVPSWNESQWPIFANEDILVFPHQLDPLDPYGRYLSPLEVALKNIDVDNAVTSFLKTFFQEGGRGNTVISYKDSQIRNKEDYQVLRDAFKEVYGGSDNWNEWIVLDRDAQIHNVGYSFREMQFDSIDARDEVRICQALKVPPTVVVTKIGMDRSTYSNSENDEKKWWRQVLEPLFDSIIDKINTSLVPDFGDDIYVELDLSGVRVLREDEAQKWSYATAAFSAGAITRNQFNEQVGLPNLGPEGDVYFQNSQVPDSSKSIDFKSTTELLIQIKSGVIVPAVGEELLVALGFERAIARSMVSATKEQDLAGNDPPPDIANRLKIEEKIQEAMTDYLQGFVKRAMKQEDVEKVIKSNGALARVR